MPLELSPAKKPSVYPMLLVDCLKTNYQATWTDDNLDIGVGEYSKLEKK